MYKNNLFPFENRGKQTSFQKYPKNIQSDGNVTNEKRPCRAPRTAGNPMRACVSQRHHIS